MNTHVVTMITLLDSDSDGSGYLLLELELSVGHRVMVSSEAKVTVPEDSESQLRVSKGTFGSKTWGTVEEDSTGKATFGMFAC